MPSRNDWSALLRSTFRDVGREDIAGLYKQEWRHAREKLTAEDHDALAREPRRWKRWFKTANSVLFGLARRLAPARRVVFLAVLACFFLSIFAPSIDRQVERTDHGTRRSVSYRVDFNSTFLGAAAALLTLLLAMELVDKINYRDELELARELQASLIPSVLPHVAGIEIGANNEIANMVGGDIYDFVPLPDGRLSVLFGDASGHGMAAGLVMAVAHAAFRTQLEVDASPSAVFATLNRILCRTGSRRAFFGCLSLLLADDGTVTAAVAGHPPGLVIGTDGSVRQRLGAGAYPLGIKSDLVWPTETARLAPGEILLLHSDGLSEARNGPGEEFGDARIEATVRAAFRLPAQELADALSREVRAFRGDEVPEDDISIAVLRRAG